MFKRFIGALGALLACAGVATGASLQSFVPTLSPNSSSMAPNGAMVTMVAFSNPIFAQPPIAMANLITGDQTVSRVPFGSPPQGIKISYTNSQLTLAETQSNGPDIVMAQLPVSSGGNWNYIGIEMCNHETSSPGTGNLGMQEMTLRIPSSSAGITLGDVVLAPPGLGMQSCKGWHIDGATLGPDFELDGSLVYPGDSIDNTTFIVLTFSYFPPADSVGPTSTITQPIGALLNGTVAVTATVADAQTRVASADYSLDGGTTWRTMSAQDGAFDSPTEVAQASFAATTVGTQKVCVRGTDSIGNVGPAACQAYTVTYQFAGFSQPVDNFPTVNSSNAGRAIPVKWQLTDANGVAISDPASFANLTSYPVSCSDFSGDPLSAVDEVAAGSSGLQYLGDGNWQFNWDTPKAYKGTCRVMVVKFNGGAASPVGRFSFK